MAKRAITIRVDEDILDATKSARDAFGSGAWIESLMAMVAVYDRDDGSIVGPLATAIGVGDIKRMAAIISSNVSQSDRIEELMRDFHACRKGSRNA